MKQVYKLHTKMLEDSETFFSFYEKLSEKRRQKIDGYRMKKDKMLSLGAGILIDKGLKKFGLREANVRIVEGTYGKPYFPDYPDIHFRMQAFFLHHLYLSWNIRSRREKRLFTAFGR